MDSIINQVRGNLLPTAAVYLGYLLLIIGFVNIISLDFFTGVADLIIGVALSFSYMGIQIDVKNHLYRNYISLFGLPIGTWETLDVYSNTAVLRSLVKYTSYYKAVIPLHSRQTYYEVYLLDKTHRKKLLVERLTDKEQAIHKAKLLAKTLQIEYSASYNPIISARSRARRK